MSIRAPNEHTNRMKEAEAVQLEVLDIRRQMAARNPDAYDAYLAVILLARGSL